MPTIKLTEKAVDRIPFSIDGNHIEYNDSRLAGFGVRAGLKSKTYFVRGRVNGAPFKRQIGRVGIIIYDEAYQQAQAILKDADNGLSPDKRKEKEEKADEITVSQMLLNYFEVRKNLKPDTRDHYRNILTWYIPDWLDRPMRSITPDEVFKKHAEVGLKSKAQADGVFRVVRALFTVAMEIYEEEITRNPVRRLSTLKAWYKVPRRKTFVRPSQLPVYFEAVNRSPGLVADYLTALLFTGIRSASEIAKIQVSHVHLDDQCISLYDTKTKDFLYVPVSDSAAAIFKRRVDDAVSQGTPYLFYEFNGQAARYGVYRPVKRTKKGRGYIKDVRGTIKAIFAGTALEGFTPHDMRRTFLTYADEIGISNVVQKRLVGHAIPTDVTDGYKVLSMERLRAEVARIEAYIQENSQRK